jgi:UDP-N-acetylglucosamine--N-acetylmuramyl-(pentapeptide) pyrophosphoryl-undecaprenol N-acetylglucosamine transferase
VSGAGRILFLTSNGTGLGHLTRSLAIARRLPGDLEPLFITFSAAAPVVRDQGFAVEYIASYDRPGAGTDVGWTFRTRDRLRAAVGEIEPAVVVFDGTHPYERLLPALRSTGATLVWCRRALWRPDADAAPLHRTHLFDHVLEPGELDAEADRGPTAPRRAEAHPVDPIVLLDRGEGAGRDEAARELGLDPGARNVLVQLGQGAGAREAAERALRHLSAIDGIRAAALASHLSVLADVPEGVTRLDATYPIARRFAAFDAAVSAAGYNAFHELTAAGVPSLFVPIDRQTDDQAARARGAEARGIGLAATGPEDPALERRIDELLDPTRHAGLEAALRSLGEWPGAEQAATWLAALAAAGDGSEEGAGAGRRARIGVRARRAWIFAASTPRTAWRVVTQRLRRPRTRVLVLALGIEPARFEAEVERALADAGEAPARVLVITDRLDFRGLLRAGVGFEHVPADGERQPELAGGPYPAFRARRIELIRARRPRPRRVIELR